MHGGGDADFRNSTRAVPSLVVHHLQGHPLPLARKPGDLKRGSEEGQRSPEAGNGAVAADAHSQGSMNQGLRTSAGQGLP